jgi:lysophospholipase L1-like esterase
MGTWSASQEAEQNAVTMSTAATYREIVHTSAGGETARLVVTNEFGLQPLTIGATRIAISTGSSAIDASTVRVLTFGGQPSVTLPAGTIMLSDPIDITLPALANVAISLFIPAQQISQSTMHSYALQTNYIAAGNVVDAEKFTSSAEVRSWYFIKGVELKCDRPSAIVALGDSITDGAASAANANGRWPDVLAQRIAADRNLAGASVLNAGINGNRLLHDGDGESALRRLDRDVLTQAGVRYLIVLEGINDIGHIVTASPADPAESAQSIIRALKQIALRAHAHGIKVIAATITPYESCKYASPEGERMRQAVNAWVRTSKDLDGFADFEMVVRDPAHPTRFLPAYDSGDHLHPNAAGLRAMANSIELSFFTR